MPKTAWAGVDLLDVNFWLAGLGESGFDLHCFIDKFVHNNAMDVGVFLNISEEAEMVRFTRISCETR